MNYDYLNQTHDYWIKNIFPNLHHHLTITSFDDYLKRMSFLPCGKWLQNLDSVQIIRIPFVVDPILFTSKYKSHCVTYCCPAKPEDGIHRIIYQMSPMLHVEAALWAYSERKQVHFHISLFVCFHNKQEIIKLFEEITPMRRSGDTEDMSGTSGFGAFKTI